MQNFLKKMNYNICLIGNRQNPFLFPLLKNFSKNKINISNIILEKKPFSKKDHLIFKSRVNSNFKCEYLEKMKEFKTKIIIVEDLNSLQTSKIISKLKIDWITQMGTNKIFSDNLMNSSKYGIINCHSGILPNFRGCSAVEWSILLDFPIGASTHIVESKIDSGKIIKIEKMKIQKFKSYKDLRTKVLNFQIEQLSKCLRFIDKHKLKPSNFKKLDLKESYYFKPINNTLLKLVKKKLI